MKQYMFYIRNKAQAKSSMKSATHIEFVQKCEMYISRLRASGNLIAAQPVMSEGVTLSKTNIGWQQTEVDQQKDVMVGYYHIQAPTDEEAMHLAMENPEFEYVPSASVEIHEIKAVEELTGFEYPG